MQILLDLSIGAGTYLGLLAISKFFERPIVWMLDHWVFPKVGNIASQIEPFPFWKSLDQHLLERPEETLDEAIDQFKDGFLRGMADPVISDRGWQRAKDMIKARFDVDAYRAHAQELTTKEVP